jgi:hypothetical protein
MCQYNRIDDPQRYTKEELSPVEVERRIRGIIKVGRDVELKLGMPMYENNSCPGVSALLFPPCIWFLRVLLILIFLQISTLLPTDLGLIVHYPRPKELTDDEDEDPVSSPIKKCKASSAAEDVGPSREGERSMVDEPVTVTR